MKCLLSCFGFSMKRRRREQAPVTFPAPPLKVGSSKRANLEDSVAVFSPSPDKQEEHPRISVSKKVTFDPPAHSPVSVDETPEARSQIKEFGDEKVVVDRDPVPDHSNLLSTSESGGSNLASLRSYPPNHRYHNCRDSDNEDEMESVEEIDVSDHGEHKDANEQILDECEFEEDSAYMSREVTPTPGSVSSMESRTKDSNPCSAMRNLDHLVETVSQQSGYSQAVLSPVENLSEWKAAKPKEAQPLKQKENSKQLQFRIDEAKGELKKAVDTSLSSWLESSQRTPVGKANARALEPIQSETSASSHGSNSVRTDNDRPILGALTLEELQRVSASPSPRRSPSHNAADQPIIGSVGSHWSEETPAIKSSPASSFKGIPNTTSKYREDKSVKWHSTPFEARLEKALRKGSSGLPL